MYLSMPHLFPTVAFLKHLPRITTAILVSFVARGLSSIRNQIFCYTAISSAGIIGILPGYLICTGFRLSSLFNADIFLHNK
jgi:uncharacterized membrane protein YjjP (DUF1212 family)